MLFDPSKMNKTLVVSMLESVFDCCAIQTLVITTINMVTIILFM